MLDLLEQNKEKMSLAMRKKIYFNLEKAIKKYEDILLGLYIAKDEIFDKGGF
ncbi:MAG: hypothetical protein K2K06_05340 [Oscillospiraceae bacterium]|nr:hypothetical protein [Oscillospiraceae bacterium]